MHKLCPNSLGCLLESGSPVSMGLIFPTPARPGLSGVKSTAGGLLACSPNALPSVVAAPEVSFPHSEGLFVFGFPASTFPGTNTTLATLVLQCLIEHFAENNKPIVREPLPANVDGDGDNGLPGFGGEGHGSLVEQIERLDKTLSNPQPTPSQETITPYSTPK